MFHHYNIIDGMDYERYIKNSSFEVVDSKRVFNEDGLVTDFTMYRNLESSDIIIIMGDKSIYTPDIYYSDDHYLLDDCEIILEYDSSDADFAYETFEDFSGTFPAMDYSEYEEYNKY